jgi:hypothetical protein
LFSLALSLYIYVLQSDLNDQNKNTLLQYLVSLNPIVGNGNINYSHFIAAIRDGKVLDENVSELMNNNISNNNVLNRSNSLNMSENNNVSNRNNSLNMSVNKSVNFIGNNTALSLGNSSLLDTTLSPIKPTQLPEKKSFNSSNNTLSNTLHTGNNFPKLFIKLHKKNLKFFFQLKILKLISFFN